jgi:hypothetical protein
MIVNCLFSIMPGDDVAECKKISVTTRQEDNQLCCGPGVDGRTATPVAGNAGVLDLTAADPLGVLERSDTLLAAKSAVLTLRNTPRQDLSRSLVTEYVPAAPIRASSVRIPSEVGPRPPQRLGPGRLF